MHTIHEKDKGNPHGTLKRGNKYLRADSVYIRACDGAVMISYDGEKGPLRHAVDDDLEMANALPLVVRLKKQKLKAA